MMNRVLYTTKEQFKTIPFAEIILPYAESFIAKADLKLSPLIKDRLEYKLLEELSYIAEVTLQSELDIFTENGNTNFEQFTEITILSLATNYPVLDEKLKIKSHDFCSHIDNLVTRFYKDIKNLEYTFNLEDIDIVNVDVCLGDRHNGEGTSLVCLSDGTKLIYKPRNIAITHSYNYFISWINCKLKTDLKTFKVLVCGNYGWIEFVNYEAVSSEEDFEEYYYKAGILLAVTLLLGSKDCHHSNIIASGKNPVIIDHETIIQPFFNDKSFVSWGDQFKIPSFSVLESDLIIDPITGAPPDIVGYGIKGCVEAIGSERKVTNPNTINSKITTHFITRKLVEKNIPMFRNKYVFANEFKVFFIKGFSVAYDLFLDSKIELQSQYSPLQSFTSSEVRYVWRPTFIYHKILKYMRAATFMSSSEIYYSKLYELLSKAYKGGNLESYKFILDIEVKQMLKGDIPVFALNSQDEGLATGNDKKIFELTCIENIFYRLEQLSNDHKNEQLKYITRWLSIQFR